MRILRIKKERKLERKLRESNAVRRQGIEREYFRMLATEKAKKNSQ